MASDDNEAKPGALGADDASLVSKSAKREAVETAPAEGPVLSPRNAATEWTASDARGPLNEAKPLPDSSDALGPAQSDAPVMETDHVPPAAEQPVSAAMPPDAGPVPRRASLWPLAAGVVLGALIGAGSAYYVYTSVLADPSADKIAALTRRLDALDNKPDAQQSIAPLKTALTDLTTKVAAADAAARTAGANADAAKKLAQAQSPAAATDTAGLAAKVAALETTMSGLKQNGSTDDVKALQAQLTTIDTKLGTLEKASGEQAATAGKVVALAAGLEALQHQTASNADVQALQKQAGGAQAALQALQAGQKSLEGKITSAPGLAVVSDSLLMQIDRGLPFTPQVNALESLGVDPAKIALLRQWSDQGVPAAPVLAAKFEPLVDGILTAPESKSTGAPPSFLDRMKAGLGGLVAVHRVDETGGDDLASHVARIRADLAHDDVIGAVATWNTLPDVAKTRPQAAAWAALAKTHADALAAATAIESGAIAALGPKKS